MLPDGARRSFVSARKWLSGEGPARKDHVQTRRFAGGAWLGHGAKRRERARPLEETGSTGERGLQRLTARAALPDELRPAMCRVSPAGGLPSWALAIGRATVGISPLAVGVACSTVGPLTARMRLASQTSGVPAPRLAIRPRTLGLREPTSGLHEPSSGLRRPTFGLRTPTVALENPRNALEVSPLDSNS